MKPLIVIFAFIWIGCSACREKCKVRGEYLSEQQLRFANFKEGSYWIMRDSMTGVMDSFVVVKTGRSVANTPKVSDGCYNQFEIMSFYIDEYNMASHTKIDSMSWQMFLYGSGSQVFYGKAKGDYYYISYFNFNRSVNTYLINGKIYDSVYVSENDLLYMDFKNKILKIAHTDTTVWELVHSYIRI